MGYHFINESKWIGDIKAGNKAAFQYAFDYFYANLCQYTANLSQDPDSAEDIVQEVFINIWKKKRNLLITTSLKSYLYKACYNKYIDTYRKEKKKHLKLEEFRRVKLMELQEEDASIQAQKIKNLNEVIQALPPKCKEVFLLSKYEGLKYQEIAAKQGISIKTVENQISLAYSKLRKALHSEFKKEKPDYET